MKLELFVPSLTRMSTPSFLLRRMYEMVQVIYLPNLLMFSLIMFENLQGAMALFWNHDTALAESDSMWNIVNVDHRDAAILRMLSLMAITFVIMVESTLLSLQKCKMTEPEWSQKTTPISHLLEATEYDPSTFILIHLEEGVIHEVLVLIVCGCYRAGTSSGLQQMSEIEGTTLPQSFLYH